MVTSNSGTKSRSRSVSGGGGWKRNTKGHLALHDYTYELEDKERSSGKRIGRVTARTKKEAEKMIREKEHLKRLPMKRTIVKTSHYF